jgi:hypothetical protein
LVLRRLRDIFGGQDRPTGEPSSLYGLEEEERARIGTEEDPLRNFEAAMQRNEEAELAVESGDTERASLYESRHNLAEALRVSEAFTKLAASGKMPRGAQRSADRKLPEFEARIQRYRRSLDEGR